MSSFFMKYLYLLFDSQSQLNYYSAIKEGQAIDLLGSDFSQKKKAERQMAQPEFRGIDFPQDSITIWLLLLDLG